MYFLLFSLNEWYSQIDWSATGSMLGAIGTCTAAFFAIVIAKRQNDLTKKIADKQFEQAKLEMKITLYEKRFVCYQLLKKYLYIGNIFKHKQKEIPSDIQQQIIESVYYSNEADRESLANEIRSLYGYLSDSQNFAKAWMKQASGVDLKNSRDYEKNKKRITEVDRKLLNLDYEYSERQIGIIKTAKFCFPDEIANPTIKYISLIFNWDAYEKKCLNEKEIIVAYDGICSKKIIASMENLLTLSYEELEKNDEA